MATPGSDDHTRPFTVPFDSDRLDRHLDLFEIVLLVASSKHNLRYLLGGYRFFFFAHFDAIGVSRYLPLLIYPKRRLEDALYVGHPMESGEVKLGHLRFPNVQASTRSTAESVKHALKHIA